MILQIFFKELRIALLNRRLAASCIALVILMVVSGIVFEKRYRIMQREYEAFLMQEGQGIEAITNKKHKEIDEAKQRGMSIPQAMIDEHLKLRLGDLIFLTRNISKEPAKLSFITSHNSALPNGLEMDYFRTSVPQTYSAYNRYFRSFVALDWANIIMYFLSFICLCFAYDAFSGEKEQGTLKLMLASSVPRRKILLGKFFALWCILLTPVVIGVVIHLLIAQFSSGIALTTADYGKIIVFLFALFLFIGVNILLFYAISLFTPHSTVSSIVCLLVWIVFVFVLPNTGWLIAGKLYPIPSIAEQKLREEALVNDADDKSIRWSDLWRSQWEQHAEDVHKWKDKRNRMEAIHRDVWEDYRNRLFRQTDMSIALSKISPFMVFRLMNDRIADNNYYGYRNFHRQAVAYQDDYRSFIIDKDAADPRSRHLIWNDPPGWDKKCLGFISNETVAADEIPVFAYRSPDISALLYNCRGDIAILLLWLAALFGLVYFAFARYDVR